MKVRNKLVSIVFSVIVILFFLSFTGCAEMQALLNPGPAEYVPDSLINRDADYTWEVTSLETWNAAISGINKAGEDKKHIISISRNFAIHNFIEFDPANIAVILEGNVTLQLQDTGMGRNNLTVKNKQAITIRDLKLQGMRKNDGSLINISPGGTFIMEGNATVSGNNNISDYSSPQGTKGGGVIDYGICTMKDNATVTDNSATIGGGLYIYGGTLTMSDNAMISNNSAGNAGGGVYLAGGTFNIMNNATVSGNKATGGLVSNLDEAGGGIYILAGILNMWDNASISGNSAINGGGVCCGDSNNITFNMKGGSISGNTSIYVGGGVCAQGGYFNMEDGVISGNHSTNAQGGGVYLTAGGIFFNKTGGIIYGSDVDPNLRNTATTNIGCAIIRDAGVGYNVATSTPAYWRNSTAGPDLKVNTTPLNPDDPVFWESEGVTPNTTVPNLR